MEKKLERRRSGVVVDAFEESTNIESEGHELQERRDQVPAIE